MRNIIIGAIILIAVSFGIGYWLGASKEEPTKMKPFNTTQIDSIINSNNRIVDSLVKQLSKTDSIIELSKDTFVNINRKEFKVINDTSELIQSIKNSIEEYEN